MRFSGSASKLKMVKSNIDCVYCVIVTGEDGFHEDRYTCTMDHANFLKLKNHINRYKLIRSYLNFYALPVAFKVTPIQLKKFSNYQDSKEAISKVMEWFGLDTRPRWKKQHKNIYQRIMWDIRNLKRHQLLNSVPGDKLR